MSQVFWQAKIWGLLHDPVLKALHDNRGRGGNSFWQQLAVMRDWTERGWNPETSSKGFFQHIHLADFITSASDRGAIGATNDAVNYNNTGIEITHLLSGQSLQLQLAEAAHQRLLNPRRAEFLQTLEDTLLPETIQQETDARKVFWWLWRCLPIATCQAFEDDQSLLLLPADTRIPDSSIWNHTSLTAAMAGSLAGFDLTIANIENWKSDKKSHPYLAAFSFTPIQELIKASRKMRDFWAGSWILHYLSAKVAWALAWKYGPDSLLYPSLFKQPLIDYWLLHGTNQFQGWGDFSQWVAEPSERQLLTAGFPNILILILPKEKVPAAMQMAEATLKSEWSYLTQLAFDNLTEARHWMPGLTHTAKTWGSWLDSQWQTYWSAVAIGKEGATFKSAAIASERESEFQQWLDGQNRAYDVQSDHRKLFQDAEINYLRTALQYRQETQGRSFSVNVGSWWPFIFDKTRAALAGSKNVRTWELPTAFGVRSSISGLGPAVHPGNDWLPEREVKRRWQHHAGLFDGREQLNATETVKRTLHQTLRQALGGPLGATMQQVSYPDLTTGVAGYLKAGDRQDLRHFRATCQQVERQLASLHLTENLTEVLQDIRSCPWGIPLADEDPDLARLHPRLLCPEWLLEDFDAVDNLAEGGHGELQAVIDRAYPGNKPTDWYVLAAGDGDGMNEWLKGEKLKPYTHYVASRLQAQSHHSEHPRRAELQAAFNTFLQETKRMGPSTHSGLSRALLDFSNQLVPYLTERRYAGRLIYSGGDDVLAYTSLWEWDQWLWDIRQCFRGQVDPGQQFDHQGHYWQWSGPNLPHDAAGKPLLDRRPLFTMGAGATISFGIVIAHHSVPLAIALEQLWQAETEGAKQHLAPDGTPKDAVQVCVLYGNGNTLKATAKFSVFRSWQTLLAFKATHPNVNFDPALFEQAAEVWRQYPIPVPQAIDAWVQVFCDRRDRFSDSEAGQSAKREFQTALCQFIRELWQTTLDSHLTAELQYWLKLAAFVLRKREIQRGGDA